MADSIPSLRRKLEEALAGRDELRAKLAEKPAEVVVEKRVEVPVEVVRWKTREVEKVVPVHVVRRVEVPVERVVHVTDPALEDTIRKLQERLAACQCSQSGL